MFIPRGFDRWSGPALRLASYGWAYVAQFVLTLMVGVDGFAQYAAATALGMIGAFVMMAGVTDLLTRHWNWLLSTPGRLGGFLLRFVVPRLGLSFAVPAALALILGQRGLALGVTQHLWLLVGLFGLLSVTIDLFGVMMACLGRPSVHIIASNGLLGTGFFLLAGWIYLQGDAAADLFAVHVGSQILSAVIVGSYLLFLLSRLARRQESEEGIEHAKPHLGVSMTVTALHIVEVVRTHLPLLLIQAVFQSAVASALVASLRFSRAADVMSSLTIAQYTRAIVTGGREASDRNRRRAQRLCIALTALAALPVGAVVVTLCHRQELSLQATAFVTAAIVASSALRQITAIEIWMAKVVMDPGPALRRGLIVEALRFSTFGLTVPFDNIYASVGALVAFDLILLLVMLRLHGKPRQYA